MTTKMSVPPLQLDALLFLRSAAALLRFACGVSALLLLFAAWYGGFRLRTRWGVISMMGFDRVMWTCVALAAASAGLSRLAARSSPDSEAPEPPPLSRVGIIELVLALCLAHTGLWIRACYLSYHAHLLSQSTPVFPPLWTSAAVYAAVSCCSAAVWAASRRRGSDAGTVVAVLLMALSPLMLHVSSDVAAAYAGVLATWGAGACLSGLMTRFRVWGTWPLALVTAVAGALVLHFAGYGWAGGRVARQVGEHLIPVTGVLALVASGMWRTWREKLWQTRATGGALLAAALGLVFSGIRQSQGDLGVVWMMPLTAILGGCGVAQILEWGRRFGGVYGRNMALIFTFAMVIATARAGMQRSVIPPTGADAGPPAVAHPAIERGPNK